MGTVLAPTPMLAEELRRALDAADVVPLLMVLVQMTGEDSLLDELRPYIKGPWDFSESIPAGKKQEIRARLFDVLMEHAAGGYPLPSLPSDALMRKMMSASVGEPVPAEYTSLMLEEMALEGLDLRGVDWRRKPPEAVLRNFHVVVIGAGMSGLCAAIRLRQAGIPFSILEKNEAVGGTWYENRYPGCGVDTPNHFYCYSFEPYHDWSHYFSKRDELWAYFQQTAEKHDIHRRIRFRAEVQSLEYDEDRRVWRITYRADGNRAEIIEATAVIMAVGQLNRPAIPDIRGLSDFKGPVFHTAQWDGSQTIRNRRVAMIGTGASGMQVAPAIAPLVERLTIFQRSPHWVVANPNYHRTVAADTKWALAHVPYYARWYRFQLFWGFADGLFPALQIDPDWRAPDLSVNATNERYRRSMIHHIEREIGDDLDLLEKVVPNYPPYGKRILIDNHWYRTLKRSNVELVTQPIDRIDPRAIVCSDGTSHEIDLIVLATGFRTCRILWPMNIVGRGGCRLQDVWGEDDPRAYLGITVPSFPNLFILFGPNTALGHGGSAIFQTECQVRYVMQCLRDMLENAWASIECRPEVHDAYNTRVDDALERMVWSHRGMSNWYKNKKGRVVTNSPWRLVDYWAMTAQPNYGDFIVVPAERRVG